MNTDPASPESGTPPFAQTRWTLILRARGDTPEARKALSELCEAYYQPVLRFLRRERRDHDVARELAHEFFARILSGGGFGGADPERGRFRSYLLGALKHFLADQREREQRLKRGAGIRPESLEAAGGTDAGPAMQVADPGGTPSDEFFDREWALALMDRALEALANEFNAAGKAEQFAALKPWLVGDSAQLPQAEVARRLGLSETAVKVAIHRLRKRFREMIRSEISQTVGDPGAVEGELHYLVEVLSGSA